MENKTVKIGFTGDIMCELPLLRASKEGGSYDFSNLYIDLKEDFKAVDYMVGNLETVCAGQSQGLTNHIFSFNSPDKFIEDLADSGIDMVTIANNHCLDRGLDGLIRTHELLDKWGLEHIGTYSHIEERKRVFIKEFQGKRIAFLAYSYGTNSHFNGVFLDEDQLFHLNLLQPQNKNSNLTDQKPRGKLRKEMAKLVFKFISLEQWLRIKKRLAFTHNVPRTDNDLTGIDDKYLAQLAEDIKKAKEESDYIIMCLHSGGQFNLEPGLFTDYIMSFLEENGVDLVIGHHPHIIQKYEKTRSMPSFFSLGNYSFSPSSVYSIEETLPQYGLLVYPYLDLEGDSVELVEIGFSFIKMLEDSRGGLRIQNIKQVYDELEDEDEKTKLKNDVQSLYKRLTGLEIDQVDIKKEYSLDWQ